MQWNIHSWFGRNCEVSAASHNQMGEHENISVCSIFSNSLFFVKKNGKKVRHSVNPAFNIALNHIYITYHHMHMALQSFCERYIFEAARYCIDGGHLAFQRLDTGKIFKQISTWVL